MNSHQRRKQRRLDQKSAKRLKDGFYFGPVFVQADLRPWDPHKATYPLWQATEASEDWPDMAIYKRQPFPPNS